MVRKKHLLFCITLYMAITMALKLLLFKSLEGMLYVTLSSNRSATVAVGSAAACANFHILL